MVKINLDPLVFGQGLLVAFSLCRPVAAVKDPSNILATAAPSSTISH
jgi:hypothetical protein